MSDGHEKAPRAFARRGRGASPQHAQQGSTGIRVETISLHLSQSIMDYPTSNREPSAVQSPHPAPAHRPRSSASPSISSSSTTCGASRRMMSDGFLARTVFQPDRCIATCGRVRPLNHWAVIRCASNRSMVGGASAGKEYVNKQTQYSLILTLKARNVDVDLYTPIRLSLTCRSSSRCKAASPQSELLGIR